MTIDREDVPRRWRGLVPSGLDPRSYLVTTIAAVCQAATLLVTWPLWQARDAPPNLPSVPAVEDVSWGLPLLVLAVLAVRWPRWAGSAFLAVYTVAVLGDQARIQPEVISLGLLMSVPAFGPSGRAIARWQLSATWLWSGLNKALSLGWAAGSATYIADALHLHDARGAIAWIVPVTEIALGLGALWPRAWRATAVTAVALHLGIFITLSPLFGDANPSVWAWNLGLAAIGFTLFWTAAPEPLLATTGVQLAALALMVTPALFYGGMIDAYLAHNLYASNTATAVVCRPGGGCATESFDTFDTLRAAFPPEARLYRELFALTCASGAELVITGPRTRLDDTPEVTRHPCPSRVP